MNATYEKTKQVTSKMIEKQNVEKFTRLLHRQNIPIYEKMKPTPSGGNVVNYKKEKLYDYYICDCCGEEIKILKQKHEMTGGIVIMPYTVTKKGDIKLALCNKCLKPVLSQFENVPKE